MYILSRQLQANILSFYLIVSPQQVLVVKNILLSYLIVGPQQALVAKNKLLSYLIVDPQQALVAKMRNIKMQLKDQCDDKMFESFCS